MKNKIFALLLAILLSLSLICCGGEQICDHIYGKGELLDDGSMLYVCGKCSEQTVSPPSVAELDTAQVTALLAPSMVTVVVYGGDGEEINRGSGFFIDGKGTFFTNAHVIVNCSRIDVVDSHGNTHTDCVIIDYNYSSSDYAVCRAKGISTAGIETARGFQVGDPVYALGFPSSTGVLTVSEGCVSSLKLEAGGKSYASFTAEISSGCSGGVLADGSGRALGIITGIHYTGVSVAIVLPEITVNESAEGVSPENFFASEAN